MRRLTLTERLGHWYAGFKASPLFILLLIVWVGGAMLGHFVWHTDRDWGALNLSLSIEAAISGALLIADIARGEAHRRRQDEHSKRQSEAMLTLLKAIRDAVEEK